MHSCGCDCRIADMLYDRVYNININMLYVLADSAEHV